MLGLGMGARVRHAGGRALKRFGGRDAAIAIGGRGGGLSWREMPVLHHALLAASFWRALSLMKASPTRMPGEERKSCAT